MYKLTKSKENINVSKLHDELGDLGEEYYLTHDETEFYLMFPNLFKRETDTLDEEGNITRTVISYEKKITSTVTEIVDGEEVTNEVDTFTTLEFDWILARIDDIIFNHDPTPPQMLPTFQERIAELENTILFILGGM